ncbi:AMP-binding protein, partial [Streptomyces sp. NPDC058286]
AQGPFLRRVFTHETQGATSSYGGLTVDASGCHYFPLGSIDAPAERALVRCADQVAFFLLSGNATAEPQLIPRTHNDYAYQARAAAELVSLTEKDVYLAALPAEFNFTFGCPGIVGTLSAGGTVVLVENSGPPECLPVIERERVTITSVTPAVARLWLDALATDHADLSSLRLVQIGDAPLRRATAERIAPELGCLLQQVFGMAEGLLTLTRLADPDETVLTTQGRPLSPDDEIRIVDADGTDVPEGELGELLARGPYTPRGYYRAPDRNAHSFTADGYLRTGDLARRTPDGNLVVTGRLSDLLRRADHEDPSGL